MKKLLLLGFFCLLFVSPLQAAVTVVDTPTGNDGINSTLSWTHTASGNGLFVCAVWSNPATTLNDITYNSVSFVANQLWSVGQGGVVKAAAFLMLNPPAGAHTVTITWSASVSVGGASYGLSGLETSSLANSHRTIYTQAAAAVPSITVTDSQNGDVVGDCTSNFDSNNGALVVGSGQTDEFNLKQFGGSSSRSGGLSTETATGANTVMSWSGATGATGGGATSFVASSGGGGPDVTPFYRRRVQ